MKAKLNIEYLLLLVAVVGLLIDSFVDFRDIIKNKNYLNLRTYKLQVNNKDLDEIRLHSFNGELEQVISTDSTYFIQICLFAFSEIRKYDCEKIFNHIIIKEVLSNKNLSVYSQFDLNISSYYQRAECNMRVNIPIGGRATIKYD